jgi:hypothetical protein
LGDLPDEGDAAPRLPTGALATQLLKGLRLLSDRLSPPVGEMSYKQRATWLQELLENLGFYNNLAAAGEIELISAFDLLLSTLASRMNQEILRNYERLLSEPGKANFFPTGRQKHCQGKPSSTNIRFVAAVWCHDSLSISWWNGTAVPLFPWSVL